MGDQLVIRLHHEPTPTELADLNELIGRAGSYAMLRFATATAGAQSASAPAAVAAFNVTPGEAGDQTTNEIAYTSYARVAVARTSGGG